MLMASSITVKQCLKLWFATITSAPAMRPVQLGRINILKMEKNKLEIDELRREYKKNKSYTSQKL